MENQKKFKTPKNVLARMQVVHFGKVLFNMQFIVVAIMAASVISFIIPFLYYIMLASILVFSLFSLLANDTFMSLWSGGETLTKIASILTQSWKYTVPLVAILSIASIVCLCFDKHEKHIAKIVVSVIICVIALVVLFFKLVNMGVIK